ncbi:hypothetical protein CEP54_012108 [Fusarium duplospermum]|uniref:SET domain-containing protein n=1 Tax=Fusarium duplospermum TaxID=1325734 RepID=A0A428PAR1_9HYPO|nr:hypothetical protein CEP54_012108 [Fusarium duplospermum]
MEEILYENSVYMIRRVPGKGYGMVAASKIPQGTRILAEAPLVRLTEEVGSKYNLRVSIAAKLDRFPPNYRKAYLELWNSYPDESKEVAIAWTNALPLGPKSSNSGVFLQASRFNHSCLPNAQETWNENLEKLTIHACTDIEEGQEITITYLKKLAGRKARQQALQDDCRFRCLCSLCSQAGTQRKLSDERLEEIQKLNNEVASTMAHQLDPLSNLHKIHRMLELMTKEGIRDVRLPKAYQLAFLTTISHGDLARARIFADRAFHSRRTVEGDDSPMVAKLEQLTRHPDRHLDYRRNGKWKSNIEDAPGGFPVIDFENWAWRQDNPRQLQFASLRCTETFPCFNDLPGEHEASTEFFETTDAFNCQPKKIWVFLGDILEVVEGEEGDLKVTAEDKNWKRIPVLIRTSEFGETFDRSVVKAGCTIVIPFPVKDEDMEGPPGIVVDKLNGFKILPIELEDLLFLSDRVQFYSSLADGKTRCRGCKKESATLQPCGGCFFFQYCNETRS